MRKGSIGLSFNPNSFISRQISKFARDPYDKETPLFSHCFITVGDILGQNSLIEATLKCQVIPLANYEINKEHYCIFELKKATDSEIDNAVKIIYTMFAGSEYGYSQYPWWVWRWFLALFKIRIKNKPWFKDGITCSELVYLFFWYLGGEYRKLVMSYNPDTITHYDIRKIIIENPNLFVKVLSTNYNF